MSLLGRCVRLGLAVTQQQPCVMDAPNASGSALLDGSVRVAVRMRGLMVTERISALDNSISRSIHQEPRVRVARGRHGPCFAQAPGLPRNAGIRSSMSPSHLLAGPRPRRTLRSMSVMALCVAREMKAPCRSAVALAWYR